MSDKTLITGPAGCGSTSILLNRVAKKITDGLDVETVVVVPNYEHLENLEIRLVEDFNIGGIRQDLFLTPDRLARKLAPRVMQNTPSRSFQDMLLRELLFRHEFGLTREGGKSGFRRRLTELFHELRSIHPGNRERLLNLLENDYPDGASGNRIIAKAVRVFKAVENELGNRNLVPVETARFRVGENVSPSDLPKYVYISGFDDIDEPQFAILSPILDNAREAVVTLPGGDGWSFKQSTDIERIFLEMDFRKETISGCERYGNDTLKEIEKAVRTGQPLELPDAIPVIMTDNNRDEADYIARETRVFIELGIKPEEILVIHPNPTGALAYFNSAFERIGIPLKSNVKRILKELSPSRDLLAILSLIAGDFDHAMPLAISRYAINMGKLLPCLDRKTIEILVAGDEIDCPSDADPKTWELLKNLVEKSRRISDVRNFRSFVDDVVSKTMSLPANAPPDYSKFSSNSWSELNSVLDEIVDFHEKEKSSVPGSFKEYSQIFMSEAGSTSVKPGDRRRSAVTLTGFEESRLKQSRVVFLAGMNDLNYPPKPFFDPLLGDNARQALVNDGFRFKTRAGEQDRNAYLLYSSLTRASEKLIVTFPSMDERGETLELSPSLTEIFPHASPLVQKERPAFTWDDLLVSSALTLDEKSGDDKKNELLESLRISYPRGHRIIERSNKPQDEIPIFVKIKNGGESRIYSASALNDYAGCPFIYFASDVLKLPQAEIGIEKILTPLIRGKAVHEYLALRLGPERRQVDLRELLENQNIDLDDFDFVEDSILEDLITVLENYVRHEIERIENSELKISHVEFSFGMGSSPPLRIELEIGERAICGRIDRIDELPDGNVAVFDYKTLSGIYRAKMKFEEACMFQLPMYVIALAQMGMDPLRAGIIVIGRDGVVVLPDEKDNVSKRNNAESLASQGGKAISDAIQSIEEGRFPLMPSDKENCGWDKCGYYHVCRTTR